MCIVAHSLTTHSKCHQKFLHLIRHCRIGSKVVPQHYSFFVDGPEMSLLPPQSYSPGQHADQAAAILARICGVDNPEDLKPNELIPKFDFFLGPVVEHLAAGAIHEVGVEVFSEMLSTQKKVQPPGLDWMPLHLLSFAGTFASLFICSFFRVYG